MIVDSSALLAILLDEPEADRLSVAIGTAVEPRISAANWFEAAMVADNREGGRIRQAFDELTARLSIVIVPLDAQMAAVARDAHRRFGRNQHSAGLNFGDCFAYALASVTDQPLLFKGADFGQTDIQAAPY